MRAVGAKPCEGGPGACSPWKIFEILVQFGGIWCVFFGEQIDLSYPVYFRAYLDTTREIPIFS